MRPEAKFGEVRMHTAFTVITGLLILALVFRIRRIAGLDANRGMRCFIVGWLAVSLANAGYGVWRAGFSIADEVPFFVLGFGIPAVAAVWVCRMAGARVRGVGVGPEE